MVKPGESQPDNQPAATPDASAKPLAVVGVGASAGGLKALTSLLGAAEETSGLAFVVIQHRTPNNEQLLVDLLAKATRLPVRTADDGVLLEPDHVYIAPAGLLSTLENGRLRIEKPAMPSEAALPIDLFFRSLATDQQEKAIGVVLSGTGADGTNGLRSIKESGGLVVAQDPATAEFDGMPTSAIATGMADYVLAPERIPGALIAFARQPYLRGAMEAEANAADSENADPALDGVLGLLGAHTNRDHHAYKTRTLVRRIERRMGIRQIADMAAYRAFLDSNPAEIEHLSRDILISVTRFFRDPPAFELLAQEVLAPLVRDRQGAQPIRAWVPACATGEEAYSIAMLLMEVCAQAGKACDIRVFGSDVDRRALAVARNGLYPETISADVSTARLERFFTKTDTGYRVVKPLRDAVTFAQHDLFKDPPFSNLDLVSCRNVLIYIEPEAQKRIFGLFHFGLVPDGCLFLGTAEAVDSRSDLFAPLSKKWRLYRRIGPERGGRRASMASASTALASAAPAAATDAGVATRVNRPSEILRQALLLEYAPAAVLIDQRNRIQYLFGPTSDFLDLPTGEPPWDLTAMTRGDLRAKLRGAVAQAVASRARARIAGVRHKRHGALVFVTITVIPVRFLKTGNELLLVTFTTDDAAAPTGAPAAIDSAAAEQIDYELRVTRQELHDTLEELGSANESLRVAQEENLSISEEYQSTNEELETSKEELQSLNEELSTLNSQLHEKVDELEVSSNDLTNLLSSTDIATVFLSPDLRIKRFTPTATRLFTVLPQDIGRPITDLSRRFTDPGLVADIQSVLASLTASEREVTVEGADRDATFLRRIQPYRTEDGRVEGVVLTFSDVTPLKRTSIAMALQAEQNKLIADLARKALAGDGGPDAMAEATRMIAEGLNADSVLILSSGGDSVDGPPNDSPDRQTPTADGLTPLSGFGLGGFGSLTFSNDARSLAERVLLSRQPIIVGNIADDPEMGAPSPGLRAVSGLGAAFGGDGKLPSVLLAFSQTADHFAASDLDFVQAIAGVLGLAMARADTLALLRADRDFAKAIVNTVREPLLVLDESLSVVEASAAFYQVFATTPAATLGHALDETANGLFAAPALRGALLSVIPDDAVIDALEITVGPDADAPRRLLLNARRMNQAGRLILLAMEDVTQRTRAREEMAAAKLVVEQASASKTRFLAAASHDLRQPVQALVMFQYLLGLQPLDAASGKLLSNMGNSLGALTAMLDDILDVSRLDAGIIRVTPQPFLIDSVIASLCVEIAPLAEAAGLALRSVPTRLAARSDPKLLVRILRNFIVNAVKHTGKGRILVGCRREGGSVRIQVWDTGPGIAKDQLTAIFEEFHQVGNVERDRRQGLGLGLAIVDRLAKLLDHPIHVRSTLGKGSLFEILVPLAPDGVSIPVGEEAPPLVGGEGERVLVIDDDPTVLDGVAGLLTKQGYEVVTATDGDAALNKLDDRPPRLVLADFRLKGEETGSEAIRRLGQRFGVALPGILLTGDTSPTRIREASDSGYRLLHKPLGPQALLSAMRDVLTASRIDADNEPGYRQEP